MAETLASPPSYIRFDKKQREEFLSQFGITAPNQRELFQQLCDNWRPLIDFDHFVAARSAQFSYLGHEIENLMARLKSAKLGTLSYKKNERGERVPQEIVLCEENDDRFWFYFLQDLLQQAFENPRNPYLTLGLLKTREILIPSDRIEDLGLTQLSKTGIDGFSAIERTFHITTQSEKILATSQTLNLILAFSSAKLRYHLKNPELAAAASRLVNLTLSEVTKRVEDKESGFWRSLTESLLKSRDDLMADRRLHLDKSFFQAAELFYSYLTNQLEELRKQKEQAQERETDMKQVEQIVLQDKDVVMVPADLEGHLKLLFKEKYGKIYDGFKDEFYIQYTQIQQKAALPVLITVKEGFIHRTNFYRFFLRRFDALQKIARDEYILRMERHLKTGNRAGDVSFVSRENLERSLSDWVSKADSFVHEVLTKPKLLAETLIHYGKTVLNMTSVEEMRGLMEQFFKPGVMSYRPFQEIFDLDIPLLFEDSFKRLSIFSQFFWRLTGRYRMQAEQFSLLSLGKPDKRGDKSPAKMARSLEAEADVDLENLSPEEKKQRRQEWLERKRNGTGSSSKKGKNPEKPVPAKHYSPKERDQAWTSFRDSIDKK